MKNITLSADEQLISVARKQAEARGKTLNQEFREWLSSRAVTPEERLRRFDRVMKKTAYFRTDRRYTRDEMNER